MKGTTRNIIYLLFIILMATVFFYVSVKLSQIFSADTGKLGYYLILELLILFILTFSFLFVALKGILYFLYETKKKVLGINIKKKFFTIIFLVIMLVSVPFNIYHIFLTDYLFKQWGGVLVESTVRSSLDFSRYYLEKETASVIGTIERGDEGEILQNGIKRAEISLNLAEGKGLFLEDMLIVRSGGVLYEKQLGSEESLFLGNTNKSYNNLQQNIIFRKTASKYFVIFSIVLVTIVLFVLVIWIGGFLGRDIITSIENLLKGTEEIKKGNFDFTIEKVSDDELGILIDRFVDMKDRIKDTRRNLVIANEKLKYERDFQKLSLSMLSTGTVIIGEKGESIFKNPAFIEMETSAGKDDLDMIVNELVGDFKANPRKNRKRVRVGNRFFQMKITGFENPFSGFLITAEDFSDVLFLRRVEIWQQMARQLAHELKNPLTPISLAIDRMRIKFKESEDEFRKIFPETIGIIREEITRMGALLSHFNDFAKMPPPSLVELDISKLLKDIKKLYEKNQKNIRIELELSSDEDRIFADELQMKQVFVNLMNNALSALSDRENGEIKITTSSEGDVFKISVRDNGCGIEPDDIERIYDLYFSKTKGGSGLGLAMVKRIIEEHNAEIEVRSFPGEGAEFTIVFRRSRDELPFL